LLEYIVPDFVHVLMDGKNCKIWWKRIGFRIRRKGYD
jgi:Fe-S cluster assembly ATPase SufC